MAERFAADPAEMLVAVVQGQTPVGLVARGRFMARFGPALADAPITQLMDASPLVVDIATSAAAVNRRIVQYHPAALADGFIVVDDGRYAGVGLALDLLRLTVAETDERARELELARRQAEQTSRAKSQFLANMSHELRTPLNAIIGFSEIIRDQTFGPVGSPQYRDYARDIHESGAHLLDLVNDILDLSKVEAGAIELHEELIDIADLAESSLTLVRQRAERAGIDIAVDVAADLPSVNADPRKLKQVLVNLLSNAVKFTPDGGTISVIVAAADGIRIVVADTGIGMSAEEIPVALTPFKRIDAEINRTVQGTGLGLPLSKALVEAHGGSLALASTPGKGTEVTVSLPASRLVWQPDHLINQAG